MLPSPPLYMSDPGSCPGRHSSADTFRVDEGLSGTGSRSCSMSPDATSSVGSASTSSGSSSATLGPGGGDIDGGHQQYPEVGGGGTGQEEDCCVVDVGNDADGGSGGRGGHVDDSPRAADRTDVSSRDVVAIATDNIRRAKTGTVTTGFGNCETWSNVGRGDDARQSQTGSGNRMSRHGHMRYTSGGGGGALDALVQKLQSGSLAQSTSGSGWTMSNCRDASASASASMIHY